MTTLAPGRRGSAWAVLRASLRLGLTAFGGPVAHLGYFEREYVQRRGWLDARAYAHIVALCQLLPGPTSSQVGFLVGWRQAGWRGGLAAWCGFTLPSALILYGFAVLQPALPGRWLRLVLHGLMLTAVAVVAQALYTMGRQLTPDRARIGIALVAAAMVLSRSGAAAQLAALLVGALGGALLCRTVVPPALQAPTLPPPRLAWGALALAAALAVLLALGARTAPHGLLALAAVFFRAGALVFGGGHVVLPLLHTALVGGGWVSDPVFLAGYGLAQGVPGPLFTIAAYLGAMSAPPGWSAAGAALAVLAIFLPGLLLALAGAPLWQAVGRRAGSAAVLAGINAAVLGLLAAALYAPLWQTAVQGVGDAFIALIGLLWLLLVRPPSLYVLLWCVLASLAR